MFYNLSFRVALACALLATSFAPRAASAAPSVGGAVTGLVTSVEGKPIAGAVVTLRSDRTALTARTDVHGRFAVHDLAPGSYALVASAAGFDTPPAPATTIDVRAGVTADVAVSLARTASSLLTIGHVQTQGSDTVSLSSAPSSTMNAQTYAAQGVTRVSDVLQDDVAATLVHALGGSTQLPTPVALRGPDPTETLVDIDGHQVNNGGTGAFDLSLLDPADLNAIELVKGISPSSLVGPDTIDGAINIRTLEPTSDPHGLLRLSAGSFGAFGETLQTTGTQDRLGYALSLHRTTSDGQVNQTILDAGSGNAQEVGSGLLGSTALGKLRYAFGRNDAGYFEFSFHDQSQFRDLSAALSSVPGDTSGGTLNSFAGTALLAHNAGFGFDVQTPLGAPDSNGLTQTSLLFRHYIALSAQSVVGPGADASPYLYNDRDLLTNDSLEIEHHFANSTLTFQYEFRNENLATDFATGVVNGQSVTRRVLSNADQTASGVSTLTLGQSLRDAVLRYTLDPTPQLHFTFATYYSDSTPWGQSLDPRFGFVWTPDARSAVRFSLGTTFQPPNLPELIVPPVLPNPVGGYITIGNPNLKPDRATEYGLGFERAIGNGSSRTDLSLDLYRDNLRQPSTTFLPPLDPNCGPVSQGGDGTPCPLSYQINAGDAVYQGFEFGARRRLGPFTTLRFGYAAHSAYLPVVPPEVQSGSLVVGEQTLGLPLHKATISVEGAPPLGLTFGAGLVYEGAYNELDRPPFATLNAHAGYRWPSLEIGLAATNLTDVYDQRFTLLGAGVPYGGIAGPLATDAYSLQGTAFTFSVTRRF